MSDAETVIRINTPTVASEIVEDEAIIINFESGSYHSLRGVGLSIWRYIENGTTRTRLVQSCTSMYEGDPKTILDALDEFLDALTAAGLVEFDELGTVSPPESLALPNGRLPFEAPILEIYEDMQGYLLMDPIHEVDASGWPRALPPTGDG